MTLNMKPKNLTFKGHLQHNDLNSKQLLQQLLANQHRIQNLSAYMIHLTSNWDIQKLCKLHQLLASNQLNGALTTAWMVNAWQS